jgi:uncharacterized membrane protein
MRALNVMRLREAARSSLLVVPGAITLALLALSIVTVRVDDWLGPDNAVSDLFRGNVASARSVLSAIATATITLTALVFSITMLVLQMASAQYSPRVLRTYLRDANSQVALGIFVGSFVYALSVLRSLDGAADARASGVAMSIAVLLAVVTVGVFVQYINHIAHRIRVESIIAAIAQETREVIDRRHAPGPRDRVLQAMPVTAQQRDLIAPESGVVTAVDHRRLTADAAEHGARVRLCARIGDFRPRGSLLAHVDGPATLADEPILAAIQIGPERTMVQDVAFGFRQLVDIAARALSPSLNDPTTAAQVVDQLHDLLRELSGRRLGTGQWCDDDGVARVEVPDADWGDYVALAVDEIASYGRSHPQVVDRLRTMLHDLRAVTSGDRREVIDATLRTIDARVRSD